MSEKNFVSLKGLRALQSELSELKTIIRPKITETVALAASNGDRSENGDYLYGKRKLREIDSRIRYLAKQLDNAEVVEPKPKGYKKIAFGAEVKIQYEDGLERTIKIVGVDEIDLDQGMISYKAPLSKALINKEEGDVFIFKSPKGEVEVEVLEVSYIIRV